MENSTIEEMKKKYESIIGTISVLKQKKYNVIKDFLNKTSELYINETDENFNSKRIIEEDTLRTRTYEIDALIAEQIEILEKIEEACRKRISENFEELNNYADLNRYIKELKQYDEEINNYNESLNKREFYVLMDDEKRYLKELINKKEETIKKISTIIPINSDSEIAYIDEQKEAMLNQIKEAQKEMSNYANLYSKVKSKIEEKTNDSLIIMDTLKMIKKKRFIKELKKNMQQQNEHEGTEVIKEEEKKQVLTKNDEMKMLELLNKNFPTGKENTQEIKKEQKQQEILTENDANKMAELLNSFNSKKENITEKSEENKETETQQKEKTDVKPIRRGINSFVKRNVLEQKNTQTNEITPINFALRGIDKFIKKQPEQTKQVEPIVTIPQSSPEKVDEIKSDNQLKSTTTYENMNNSGIVNNSNPLVSKEVHIAAKVSRNVSYTQVQSIKNRIQARLNEELDIKENNKQK